MKCAPAWMALTLVLLGPKHARASDGGMDPTIVALNAAILAPPVLVFGIADVTYGGQGRWTPLGWSIPEIATATGLAVAGSVMLLNSHPELSVAYFIPAGVLLTHGILSLCLYERPKNVMAIVVPTDRGVALSISGRF